MQQRQQRFRSIVSAVDTRTSLFVNHAVMIVNVTAVYFANVYSYNYFLIKILSSDILETSSRIGSFEVLICLVSPSPKSLNK